MSNWTLNPNGALKTRETVVADKLREAIMRGYFQPGQRLDQSEIAEIFKVSRSPVREALRTLAAEELVKVYPHRGAVVAELSLEEIEEIYFLRGVLEGTAVRLAASKIDNERIAALQVILDKANKTTDLDQWLELNRDFHDTIYEAINRPRLLSIIQSLRNIAIPYTRRYVAFPEHMEATQVGHQRILDALIQRDGAQAQKETQNHLKVLCDSVLVSVESMLQSASET